ncbi:MAG TPA: hypothetical protein VN698_07085 [Bacteroidia bacterium]|nr:hypothetical protein [Bacteroidia bacterium]
MTKNNSSKQNNPSKGNPKSPQKPSPPAKIKGHDPSVRKGIDSESRPKPPKK